MEVKVGQEYISTSDTRTRRITTVDANTVRFVCIDCATIGIKVETVTSFNEFQRCLRDKIFVLTKEAKVIIEKKVDKTEVKKTEIKAPKKEPVKTTLF